MSRLIDADALLETLKLVRWAKENESKYTGDRNITVTWEDAIITVKNAPTIEPQLKKGKWLLSYGSRCSVCNYKVLSTGLPSKCPKCYAEMEG